MKTLFLLTMTLCAGVSYASSAPEEVKNFLVKSIPAECAYIKIGECTDGSCSSELVLIDILLKNKCR